MLPSENQIGSFIFELIKLTATELSCDVKSMIQQMKELEQSGSNAQFILELFLENIKMAAERKLPICQDTGMPTFYISHSPATSPGLLKTCCEKALVKATKEGYLRPNAVNPVTGKNSGNNLGLGFPPIYFYEWDREDIEVALILKGGGSENVSCQYSLPYDHLQASRDLGGVRSVVLEAVRKAEGKGCPPAILGICLGGDRATGFVEAKRQLLRPLNDKNQDPQLAELEEQIREDANRLGIGPLGLGGRSTLMAVKIGVLDRLPACYFVTVAYMCWVHRRRVMRLKQSGEMQIVL